MTQWKKRKRSGMVGMRDSYHDRPEWSYSQMKLIPESGTDYAVAAKRGIIPKPDSRAIIEGQLAHMFALGGDASIFVLRPYDSYRTKAAKEWKQQQLDDGKYPVDQRMYESITGIVDNIESHPMSKKLLKGSSVQHEVEMFAKVNSVELRGKADAILQDETGMTITDIKTTAQFDDWKYKAMRRHYDLQAAVYSLIGAKSLGVDANKVKFYFCVVETVFPYRVQYHFAGMSFIEHGEQKLANCLEEIKKFGDKEPSFLIEEVNELGDWSI